MPKLHDIHLDGICLRRPLDAIADAVERAEAAAVRDWFFNIFLTDATGN